MFFLFLFLIVLENDDRDDAENNNENTVENDENQEELKIDTVKDTIKYISSFNAAGRESPLKPAKKPRNKQTNAKNAISLDAATAAALIMPHLNTNNMQQNPPVIDKNGHESMSSLIKKSNAKTPPTQTQVKNSEDPSRAVKFYDDLIDFRGDILKRPPNSKNCRILWEYLYLLLQDDNYSNVIKWEDRSQMVFRIVQAEKLAALWGKSS